MGSCISKCRPRPPSHKHKQESLLVHDKLVISQAPTIPDHIPLPNKQSNSLISSPSPSSDSCISNITTTSTCSTSTLSSSSSSTCSSSALVSKDRSFSNEFLWARLKENPHIIPHGLDPVKETPVKGLKSVAPKFPTRKLDSSPSKSGRIGLPPQKRGRDSSPTLSQQRSFRKEFERTQSTSSSLPRRNFGSPSPSRRFNGDPCSRGIPLNATKRSNSPNRSCARKENLQLRSPINKVSRDGLSQLMRKRETCTHHIQDGINNDQNSVGAMVCNKDSNSLPIDDLNNPLISLDCFIFL
ncbi:uncharacterized protein LOC122669147 [Telopea speciosissima]|uniref:uncharacterized protein LOC122669147 n=1 Tax=Telopea speciosissima TaxID=54955 RepID=UPI001CC67BA6|nr:uncharacterized protein LOC122669147 [Telopea speciosissima]